MKFLQFSHDLSFIRQKNGDFGERKKIKKVKNEANKQISMIIVYEQRNYHLSPMLSSKPLSIDTDDHHQISTRYPSFLVVLFLNMLLHTKLTNKFRLSNLSSVCVIN